MSATDGEEVGPLLDEQRAYYRALAADCLDQGLDLPGGDEVIEALDAFQPTGSVLELGAVPACGPASCSATRATSPLSTPPIPEGRVFFDDAYRTPDELVEGLSSSTIRRQLPDGTSYRLVKVPHQPADLERRLRQLGWHIKVTSTAGPFYWGAGSRGRRPT